MNGNKVPMDTNIKPKEITATKIETIEIAALDSSKISEGLSHTNLSEAQIIAATLSKLKGLIIKPEQINCKTVTIRGFADSIDHLRKSLGDIGLREVVRERIEEAA